MKVLLTEGIINSYKRELRYILELSVKACLVSQKYSKESFEKQLLIYKNLLKNTNISMVEEIDFYFLDEVYRSQFITEVKREYGILCDYVHCTPVQIKERVDLDSIGKTLGLGGTEELFQLNNFMEKILALVMVLCLHSVPDWCVGDWIVERNGDTVESYFQYSKYFAEIDKYYDYKCDRQGKLTELHELRTSKIKF